MTELVRQAAAANGYVAAELPATVVRAISGGILPTDIQPFYSAGIQGFSTFTSTPYYHTPQDVPERVDPASLRRVSAYLRDALLALQTAAPQELAVREVPSLTVRAPQRAEAGAEIPVEIELRDPAGAPVTGAPVRILVNQNDHWARHEGTATEARRRALPLHDPGRRDRRGHDGDHRHRGHAGVHRRGVRVRRAARRRARPAPGAV